MNGWHLTGFITALLVGGAITLAGAYPGIFASKYYPGEQQKGSLIALGTIVILATFSFVAYYFLFPAA